MAKSKSKKEKKSAGGKSSPPPTPSVARADLRPFANPHARILRVNGLSTFMDPVSLVWDTTIAIEVSVAPAVSNANFVRSLTRVGGNGESVALTVTPGGAGPYRAFHLTFTCNTTTMVPNSLYLFRVESDPMFAEIVFQTPIV